MSRDTRTSIHDSTTRGIAIFIGVMFLAATVTFAAGDALVVDALGPAGSSGQLPLGVALQAVNAVAVAAIGVAFVGVLRPFDRRRAYGHLALRILEGLVVVGIGVYMLIERDLVNYEPIIYVFTGTAGLLLSTGLLRAGLVAPWLARLGVVGYLAILAALPVELLTAVSLDALPGMLLYVPGGLFEVLLPIVLIARGFRRTDAAAVAAADERGSALAAA